MHLRTQKNSPSALKKAQNEWFLSSRASFFARVPLKGQHWANYVAGLSEGNMWGEFCRTISQAHPLRRERHFGSNRKPTRRDRDSREMGMKKALPKGVLGRNAEPPPVDRTEGGRCAPGGTRTPNLLNRNQMLYPLSYGRNAVWLDTSLHALRRDTKSNGVT